MSSISDGDTRPVVRRFFGGRLAVGISPESMCLPNSRINWLSVFKTYGPLRKDFFKTFPPLS